MNRNYAIISYNGFGDHFLAIGGQEWDQDQLLAIGLNQLGLTDAEEASDTEMACIFTGIHHLLTLHSVQEVEDLDSGKFTAQTYLLDLRDQIQKLHP